MFSHGPHDIMPRVIQYGYKVSVCSAHRTGTCQFGVYCRHIHDDFRLRRGEREFWIVYPSDNLIRVEYVAEDDAKRITFLLELLYAPVNSTNTISFAKQKGLLRPDSTLDVCAFDEHMKHMMALQLKTVGNMILSLTEVKPPPLCFPLIYPLSPSSSSSTPPAYPPPLLSPTPTRPFLSPVLISPSRPTIFALPMPTSKHVP